MEQRSRALIVIKSADEMTNFFPKWPEQIGLAVCLVEDGDCVFFAFHDNETIFLPARLLKHLNLTAETVSFHPEIQGFGTRALPFSEDQALTALILGTPGLLEEAEDYLANYEYALDEHLDPMTFMQRMKKAAPGDHDPQTSVDALAKETPPRPQQKRDVARYSIRLHSESEEWIILENLLESEGCLVFGDQRQVFLRDDRKAIGLHLGAEPFDQDNPPQRIQIHSKLVSGQLNDFLSSEDQSVDLSCDGSFLYFTSRTPLRSSISPDPKVLESLQADRKDAPAPATLESKAMSALRIPTNNVWLYLLAFTIFGTLFSVGIGLGLNTAQVGSNEVGTQFFGNLSLLMTELGFVG